MHEMTFPRLGVGCRRARFWSRCAVIVLLGPVILAGGRARAQEPRLLPGVTETATAEAPEIVDWVEHLGEVLPGDIVLQDEEGQPVVLSDFIDRPTILNFVYYDCPGICTPLLNEIADILGKSQLDPARQPFQLLTVSFEPTDKPETARAKRANYLKLVGRPLPADTWRFFTGDAENLRRLTDAAGFMYKPAGSEYTHPSGIIFLGPDRRIIRYFYGIEFLPFDFQMGITEASQGKVTPTTARLLRFCFSYDPASHTYVFNLARVIAAVMLISLAFFGAFLYFSTRHKRPREA